MWCYRTFSNISLLIFWISVLSFRTDKAGSKKKACDSSEIKEFYRHFGICFCAFYKTFTLALNQKPSNSWSVVAPPAHERVMQVHKESFQTLRYFTGSTWLFLGYWRKRCWRAALCVLSGSLAGAKLIKQSRVGGCNQLSPNSKQIS